MTIKQPSFTNKNDYDLWIYFLRTLYQKEHYSKEVNNEIRK